MGRTRKHTSSCIIVALAFVKSDFAVRVVVVGVGRFAHLCQVEPIVVLDAQQLRQVSH